MRFAEETAVYEHVVTMNRKKAIDQVCWRHRETIAVFSSSAPTTSFVEAETSSRLALQQVPERQQAPLTSNVILRGSRLIRVDCNDRQIAVALVRLIVSPSSCGSVELIRDTAASHRALR